MSSRKAMAVSLDPLPLKRMLALEESGLELYPPDLPQEEKALTLLQSLDFDPVEKDAKKAKTGKEPGPPQIWQWQALFEHFKQAQEELMTLLDFINHVEANEVLNVTHMVKAKPLPHELCGDLALRMSLKIRKYKEVGKYLRTNAKALERQVERESVFYEALVRLQRNWKIKRQRKTFSGFGMKADFAINLSFPPTVDVNLAFSSRTLNTINVEPDSSGHLVAQLPPGRSIRCLELCLGDGSSVSESRRTMVRDSVRREDESDGTKAANMMLRSIHMSNFHELIFDCLSREALQPSRSTSLVQIKNTSLHVGLRDKLTAFFKLVDDAGSSKDGTSTAANRMESSSWIFLQQGFLSMLRRQKEKPPAAADAPRLLKMFAEHVLHRVAASEVVSLLEKLVPGVPQLWFHSHPTWKPYVSAWDVYFDIPQVVLQGAQIKHQDWTSLTPASKVTFKCTLVLRQETLSVEGLDRFLPMGKSAQKISEYVPYDCHISDLAIFLTTQIAGNIVMWLLEEALLLGSKVERNFLSINFDTGSGGHISLVAAPTTHGIDWWLRMYAAANDDAAVQVKEKEKTGPPLGLSSERFLGPLPLETLRALVMDVLNLTAGTE